MDKWAGQGAALSLLPSPGRAAQWRARFKENEMTVTIYHNPRCAKSRAALALIEKKGLQPRVVEYLDTPPSAAELKRILGLLRMAPREILRAKEAKDAGIDPDRLTSAQLIAKMVATPAAIERPIVVAGSKARLGRPPEAILDIL